MGEPEEGGGTGGVGPGGGAWASSGITKAVARERFIKTEEAGLREYQYSNRLDSWKADLEIWKIDWEMAKEMGFGLADQKEDLLERLTALQSRKPQPPNKGEPEPSAPAPPAGAAASSSAAGAASPTGEFSEGEDEDDE